jgi:hypothetical protein
VRPRVEERTVAALDRAISDLERLREPLLVALAHDDEPADFDDRVHLSVRKLCALVNAVGLGAHLARQRAREIASPPVIADTPGERKSSLASCMLGHETTDHLRRGMCNRHRVAYQRSSFVDVADFVRQARDQEQ